MGDLLKRLPGFRTGTRWKQIVASLFYIFLLLGLIGSMVSDPVVTSVQSARSSMEKNNHAKAVEAYKEALATWDDTKEYEFAKQDIEAEYLNAQVEALLDEASTAREHDDFTVAAEKVGEAANLLPEHHRLVAFRESLKDALIAQADTYLSQAEEALDNYDASTASSSVRAALALVPDYSRAKAAVSRLEHVQSIIAAIGEKPENSAWDAAVAPVVDYLKQTLNDAKSVQYVEWSPVVYFPWKGDPYWGVRVKYRAKNLFGAYVLQEQVALIRNGRVVLMLDY